METDEIRRSGRRPTNDLTAYDLYLRALPVLFAFPSKERVIAALVPLEEAIKRDPRYGPALALAAVGHARLFDWGEDPNANRRKGIERAHQALEASGDDPDVLANAAFALSFLGEDIGTQIELVERALLRARLVFERPAQGLGRAARTRNRAYRKIAAPQPTRP